MGPWGSRGDRRRRRARVGASYQAATGRRRGAPPLRARRARNPDAGAGGEGAVAGLPLAVLVAAYATGRRFAACLIRGLSDPADQNWTFGSTVWVTLTQLHLEDNHCCVEITVLSSC
jgi:hypothetical protein